MSDKGQRDLRVAVVGAGGMGTTHAHCWSRLPGATVAAVADVQTAKAERLAASVGLTNAAVYSDVDALLAGSGTAVDAISVCVPTPQHRPVAEAAFRAGKHVLSEKPMSLTLADCDAMIAAAQAAGRLLSVGQVVRFFPAYANAKHLVETGAVGAPAAVRTRRGGDFPRADTDWYNDVAQSGGVIFDLMVHDIDWVLWCFGPVRRVYAQGLTERLADKRIQYQDYALLTLRHESGVISHLEGTWSDPGGFATTFEIAGDGGLLTHDSRSASPLRTAIRKTGDGPGVALPSSPLAPEDDPYFREIAAFAAAVRREAPLAVTPEEARRAVAVAAAARESIRTGRAVEIAA